MMCVSKNVFVLLGFFILWFQKMPFKDRTRFRVTTSYLSYLEKVDDLNRLLEVGNDFTIQGTYKQLII